MHQEGYMPRLVDMKLEKYLSAFGAVSVEGPKWCGKTMTSKEQCNSSILLSPDEENQNDIDLARMKPSLVLQGEVPRLIDEWQEVPELWDVVRNVVDKRKMPGQFILTGSTVVDKMRIQHTGAGRFAKLSMGTMTLFETGDSTGTVSLASIFKNEAEDAMTGTVALEDLAYFCVRGGWPGAIGKDRSLAPIIASQYVSAVSDEDIVRIVPRFSRSRFSLLLKSLARNESTTATINKLCGDIADIDSVSVDSDTVSSYLDVLKRLYLITNQEPFSPSVRSATRVKQAEKRHFVDPSITSAVLGLTAESLIADLKTFGFLFEALCEHDLRIYADTIGGKLYHYQDYNNNEIDAVVELSGGVWGGFEIKLGANQIDDAARNLLRIRDWMEKKGAEPLPKVLGIISGLSNAFYKRPDGVYVIPITALRP